MMTNQVREFVIEKPWQRRRRINRMMAWDRQGRTGVVPANRNWHVTALTAALVLFDAVMFVRYFA